MIVRFQKITKGLYRGGRPSEEDVEYLKEHFKIKRIVSLDYQAGSSIANKCKELDIEHIMLPIEFEGWNHFRHCLINLFSHDFKKLFLSGKPTFFHCMQGKDRTGMVAAIIEVKYLGKDVDSAIKKAKELGFGIGVHPRIRRIFLSIIKAAKPNKDDNEAWTPEPQEAFQDKRQTFLEPSGSAPSFAPFSSPNRYYPYDDIGAYDYGIHRMRTEPTYNSTYNQINTRQDIGKEYPIIEVNEENFPEIGTYDNASGIKGAGPSEMYASVYI